MLTEEQYLENMKRVEEILNNNTVSEKITWKLAKMSSKTKKSSCIMCNGMSGGVGMFLLHKSQNSKFGLEADCERLYLYYLCNKHIDEMEESKELLHGIEDKILVDKCKNSTYVEIEKC